LIPADGLQAVMDTHDASFLSGRQPDVSSHPAGTILAAATLMHPIVIKPQGVVNNAFAGSAKGRTFFCIIRALQNQPVRSFALAAITDFYKIQFLRVERIRGTSEFCYSESHVYDLTRKEGVDRLWRLLTVAPRDVDCAPSLSPALNLHLLSLLARGASATVFTAIEHKRGAAIIRNEALRFVPYDVKPIGLLPRPRRTRALLDNCSMSDEPDVVITGARKLPRYRFGGPCDPETRFL